MRKRSGRLAAGALALLCLAGCGGPRPAPRATADQAEEQANAAAKRVARSLWGVVPDAPERKQDVDLGAIRGSAVAVAGDRLLVSCRAVHQPERVGLERQNKYRLARVIATDPGRTICVLSAPNAPLTPAPGYRTAGDLRPGEPVYALSNRDSFDVTLSSGRIEAGPDGRVAASLEIPGDRLAVVLFDRAGDLVGIGSGPATPGAPVDVAPLTASLVPGLPNHDRGASAPREAPAPTTPPHDLPEQEEDPSGPASG
jgi:S1-C subfamily serine protease